MALLWVEGWENYANVSQIYENEQYRQQTNNVDPTLVAGRQGGQALRFSNATEDIRVILPANLSSSTFYMGFAIKIEDGDSGSGRIIEIHSANLDSQELAVYLKDQRIYVGTSTSESGEQCITTTLKTNEWYYISFDWVKASSGGSINLYLNGVLTDSFTGDTQVYTSGITSITLEGRSNRIYSLDDMYFGDDSAGNGPTSQFGDAYIERLSVSGAGSSAQFTPSAGSNHENVDDATSDGDTTYNSSSSAGDQDSFAVDNLTMTSGTVHAVELFTSARRAGDGAKIGQHFTALGASPTIESARRMTLEDGTYRSYTEIQAQSPAGSDWTVSDVNSMELGYRVEG
jgi:hypothetical protein